MSEEFHVDPVLSMVCTLEELWFLREYVRHEGEGSDGWQAPPWSQRLNEEIAMGILRLSKSGDPDTPILLTHKDCLVLDYVLPTDEANQDGRYLGKELILRSYELRAAFKGIEITTREEMAPEDESYRARLEEFSKQWKEVE